MRLIRALGKLVALSIGVMLLALIVALLIYPPEYVFRVVVWQDSDAFDWQKFPSHPLHAAPTPYHFDAAPDPRVVRSSAISRALTTGSSSWPRITRKPSSSSTMGQSFTKTTLTGPNAIRSSPPSRSPNPSRRRWLGWLFKTDLSTVWMIPLRNTCPNWPPVIPASRQLPFVICC